MVYSYTDWHIVDEDERTISVHGGYWVHGVYTGIAHREVSVTSTNNQDTVAFEKKINRTYTPFGDAYSLLSRWLVAIYSDIAEYNSGHCRNDSHWKFPQPLPEAPSLTKNHLESQIQCYDSTNHT
jgi:hypothetical protein